MQNDGLAYYVSVVDGQRFGLLLGPFEAHETALAHVEDVRAWVVERQPDAHWYGFGTSSVLADRAKPGKLNAAFPELVGAA